MRVIEVPFLSSERLTGTGSLESVSGDSSSGLFWIVQVTDLHLSAEDEEQRTLGAFFNSAIELRLRVARWFEKKIAKAIGRTWDLLVFIYFLSQCSALNHSAPTCVAHWLECPTLDKTLKHLGFWLCYFTPSWLGSKTIEFTCRDLCNSKLCVGALKPFVLFARRKKIRSYRMSRQIYRLRHSDCAQE